MAAPLSDHAAVVVSCQTAQFVKIGCREWELDLRSLTYYKVYPCGAKRKKLEDLSFWDDGYRITKLPDDKVALPVKDGVMDSLKASPSLLDGITFDAKIMPLSCSKRKCVKTPQMVLMTAVQQLWEKNNGQTKWTEDIVAQLPARWEKHGDLLLLPEEAFTEAHWQTFGVELWQVVANALSAKRIARKSVVSRDGYRSPQVSLLLGQNGWVEHSDNGIKYTYDVTKCMFSAGNITEKLRVAGFNCTGETVVDLYAGIGYFSLPYLVHTGVAHLHACEWNPAAVEALQRNLILNKVADRATVHHGDNKLVCPRGVADRVNLGLIPSSEDGWETACAALKPESGGILHIHQNVTSQLRESPVASCDPVEECSGSTSVIHSTSEACTEPQVKAVNQSHACMNGSDCSSRTEDNASCRHELLSQFDSEWHDVNPSWHEWTVETAYHIQHLLNKVHGGEWTCKILHIERVKSYAPHVDHLVLDLLCKPTALIDLG